MSPKVTVNHPVCDEEEKYLGHKSNIFNAMCTAMHLQEFTISEEGEEELLDALQKSSLESYIAEYSFELLVERARGRQSVTDAYRSSRIISMNGELMKLFLSITPSDNLQFSPQMATINQKKGTWAALSDYEKSAIANQLCRPITEGILKAADDSIAQLVGRTTMANRYAERGGSSATR